MLEKLKRNQNSEQRLEESFHSKKANQSVFGKTFYKDDKDALVSHNQAGTYQPYPSAERKYYIPGTILFPFWDIS